MVVALAAPVVVPGTADALVPRCVVVPGVRVVRGTGLGARGSGDIWIPIGSVPWLENCCKFACRLGPSSVTKVSRLGLPIRCSGRLSIGLYVVLFLPFQVTC